MPIQLRSTVQDSSQLPGGNPAKHVSIAGHDYEVTFANFQELYALRVAEETRRFGSLDQSQKTAIADALRVAAMQPSSGPSENEYSPTEHEFGSFGDYLSIFTTTASKSAQKLADVGGAIPAGVGGGLSTVAIIGIAVLAYIVWKGK